MLLSISFGMLASDSAQAAFVQNLSNTNLPSTFVAYDTAWNEAGTMAVVVGFDSAATATNAYAYFPNNDTYLAIDNKGWNQQNLHAVDYFRQPIYDWPTVLLVDADWDEANVITFYSNALSELDAYVDIWDVWDQPAADKGKPTAADMAGYDLVIWVPSRYMAGFSGPGDGLNYLDTLEIMEYLDGGGNFFLSNAGFADFHSFAPGSLAVDYLGTGIDGVSHDTSYEYYARPVAMDSVFGGLSEEWMNWGSYGWSGYPWSTDILIPNLGTACFQCRDSLSAWATTGLRYDSGTFKTVYLGFPLETLSGYYATQIFQNLLDWIMPPKGALDQFNENMANPNWNYVMNHDIWAQSFMPDANTISAVEFYMYSEGLNDYFSIEIREDGAGWPTGSTLTTGYLYQSDIPQSLGEAGWVRCTFASPVSVTVGNSYWIVCTQFDESYNQYWMHDEDMSYLDGVAMRYTMGSWTFENYYDWIFRTYSSSGSTPQTVSLSPTKDNTIYSENTGNSNGAGEYLIAGTDWFPHYRRALLEFNIASQIPKYSTVNSVGLSMYCSHAYNSNGYNVNLHMLIDEWGESSSDAPDIEETGISAATGDATWDYAYYPTDPWMPGADFGASLASTWVTVQDAGYSWNTAPMRDNVQQWLDHPGTNHGWILLGDEGLGNTAKWFNSRNSLNTGTRPLLTVTYTEPTVIGYEDVFWIAGDTFGPNPPATAYKLVPSEGFALIPMNTPSTGQYYSVAIDDTGNPLFGTDGQYPYMYYYDGTGWLQIPSPTDLTGLAFRGMDFNPNDRRFYATGVDFAFYTDPVPLIGGESRCYQFNHFPNLGGSLHGQLAWNDMYDYGLVGGDACLVKMWPYGEYGNGTVRYELETTTNVIYDISWDTDGWNEAGLVGMTNSGYKGYWRYYNTNPQIIPGSTGAMGTYYACGMKPPSSPKWLFIPSGAGSIRINIEEKDESGELVVSSEFPHIFTMDMWKQSDVAGLSTMNTQVSTDSTYTFAFEGNYTRDGIDRWADLDVFITAWFDYGLTGINSQPGDPGWTLDNYRNSQFNLTFDTGTQTAGMLYPSPVAPAGEEFSIDSFWQDPATYGADNSHHRLYINVTFGPQMLMANGPGTPATGNNIWDKASALNDMASWDLRFFIRDSTMTSAYNITYNEFGIQRYASVSVSGNPSGSIPPGAAPTLLLVPTTVMYSTNVQYKLNVSIPNLYRNGNPLLNFIAPTYVDVWNDHSNAPGNSNISVPTAFNGPNLNQIIWGTEFTWIQPVGSGTVSAGPQYSDYSAAIVPEPFEVTEVWWTVEVPVGTTEGVYRGTITITLWS